MNVLLFCVDTLRRDHLPLYGYDRDTTPNLTEFAEEAHRYDDAVTVSTFTFSVASSMLSGLYPATHGALSFDDRFGDQFPVLPARLREAGYRTATFAGMSYFGEEWGLARGFDEVYGTAEQSAASTGEALVDNFLEWVDADDADDEFFGIVWSFDAHKPYVDIADKFEGHRNPAVDDYDNGIRYADEQFGRLLEELEVRGLLEETLVVFTADHGEVFDEHHWLESSRLARLAVDLDLPVLADMLREEQLGHTAIPPYEEAIRVPLFVRFPDGKHAGRSDATVQTLDLTTTIAEVAGVDVPELWQGRSLVPGEDGILDRDTAYVLTGQTVGGAEYSAARTDEAKVIEITNPSFENDTVKFYLGRRLFSARREAFDLTDRERRVDPSPVHERLFEALAEHREECRTLGERLTGSGDGIDQERREQLEAMGYL